MRESYEQGVATRSASSFALGAARCPAKRKQRYRWAGYRASKNCNQDAIAKILSPDPAGPQQTMTMVNTRALTPDYASPEQVRGEPVTTPSDIYSLGAVLYELPCGSRAHRLETRTAPEIERVVCEQPVVRPSRAAAPPDVPARQLRGDLDNIVLKTLDKDPARHYPTVEGLAGDVRRYLDGLPVLARPGSPSTSICREISRPI